MPEMLRILILQVFSQIPKYLIDFWREIQIAYCSSRMI